MKIPRQSIRPESAFTMVEISLCLAIVAFALVAIMGVLPSGLNVQRDNREDTIINQDASFISQCLRSGATNIYDLSTNVEMIEISVVGGATFYYSNLPPQMVISLLTLPSRYAGDSVNTNPVYTVRAKMRALSGPIGERGESQAARDFAFRYILQPEVTPYYFYSRAETTFPFYTTNAPPGYVLTPDEVARSNNWVQARHREQNLYEVKLNFAWPVFPDGSPMGRTGAGRQVFRTMISGGLFTHDSNLTNLFAPPSGTVDYIHFLPRIFRSVPPTQYP